MATQTTPKALERRFIEEAFNDGNLAVIDELFADDYLGHTSTRVEPLNGPDAMKRYIEWAWGPFPDLELQLEHVIEDENLVLALGGTWHR